MERMMSDTKPTLPDRLSIDPKSPHFNKDVLQYEIGIRFNDAVKTNVEEYCISENWVRMPSGGKSKDRNGNPLVLKFSGKVEVYYVEA
jgi:hypothetical protein